MKFYHPFLKSIKQQCCNIMRNSRFRRAFSCCGVTIGMTHLTFMSSSFGKDSKRGIDLEPKDAAINNYITALLNDAELNIAGIPDHLERHIYGFTVKLTFSALLYWVGRLDGLKLLGHHIQLERIEGNGQFPITVKPLNHAALNSFVKALLQDKSINISWLPDAIEHQLYFNCLLLMFTIIQSSLCSLHVRFLGHRLHIGLESYPIDEMVAAVSQKRSGVCANAIDDTVSELLAR